ncbi:hypothetical protein MNB_SM-3-1262 [hydrothermal vent metagenome]|uniref:MOSC domain-containing protein n=1 Tax=hydrothermal vent metagenome TaxID=652676 RepID=A0A1W1D3H5_9ZZZZ
MKTKGKVRGLFLSIAQQGRESREKMRVDENGVFDDKFYGKNLQRAILLTSLSSYDLAKQNNIDAKYGSLGENILIDINPYHLKIGDKIQIGTVVFEVTANCTICHSLAGVDPKLPKLLKDDRGIFIRALQSGEIYVGDEVEYL